MNTWILEERLNRSSKDACLFHRRVRSLLLMSIAVFCAPADRGPETYAPPVPTLCSYGTITYCNHPPNKGSTVSIMINLTPRLCTLHSFAIEVINPIPCQFFLDKICALLRHHSHCFASSSKRNQRRGSELKRHLIRAPIHLRDDRRSHRRYTPWCFLSLGTTPAGLLHPADSAGESPHPVAATPGSVRLLFASTSPFAASS